VPIDRTGGKASESALRAGLKVLGRGELFGIYPEGTRSHDGRLYKAAPGSPGWPARPRPVIPSAVIGTDVIAPPGKIVKRIVSPTVRFGAALDFSRYQGMSEDRFILRSITDEIMYAIMELSDRNMSTCMPRWPRMPPRARPRRPRSTRCRPRPDGDLLPRV
jgi:1-acyl-sn-glycerol-3-phosphate acyltransferase